MCALRIILRSILYKRRRTTGSSLSICLSFRTPRILPDARIIVSDDVLIRYTGFTFFQETLSFTWSYILFSMMSPRLCLWDRNEMEIRKVEGNDVKKASNVTEWSTKYVSERSRDHQEVLARWLIKVLLKYRYMLCSRLYVYMAIIV